MKGSFLPLVVIALIGTILFPLPPLVLDFLLSANLLLSLVLLMSTFYVSDPLRLSSLPTILLLATLARLALNIATTRNILGAGYAGEVVESFGQFVVGGNLVVGLVVFVIITIVQFLVVAKGSERVAEVSARFALDALPGKQMSIDADVRAGLLDLDTARQKRQDLQSESRFYGALDGAMKFVKGDAIAGILIAGINVLGGICIGTIMHGLDLGGAVSKFTLLSIGDGLLSQLPSLFCSIGAGVIVTRVARGNELSLAEEMVEQLMELQVVRYLVAGMSLLFAMIPGLPALPFFVLSLALFASAISRSKRIRYEEDCHKLIKPRSKSVPLLEVCVSEDLQQSIEEMRISLEQLREETFETTGVLLPRIQVLSNEETFHCIRSRGLVATIISPGQEIDGDFLVEKVRELIQDRSSELIDDVFTRRMLDYYESEFPELIGTLIPNIVSVTQLSIVLKNLRMENISIRNFDLILQTISEAAPKALNTRALVGEVRVGLKRVISQRFSSKDKRIKRYAIDPLLDLMLSRCEKEGTIPANDVMTQIQDFFQGKDITDEILTVSQGSRAVMKDYLEVLKISIPVVAHEELVDVELETVGCLELSNRQEMLDRITA